MPNRLLLALAAATLAAPPIAAQANRTAAPPRDTSAREAATPIRATPSAEPVVTQGSITLRGQPLRYTARTGMMPIKDDRTGIVEGNIFYVYYSKDGENASRRPISFIFNGGPGSSTVWLHMGAFGPRMVKLNADGSNAPPPYTFEDNQATLLDQTDLVFLDPVGTGYSRPTRPEYGPKFWGVDEDVRSVGEFIRLFLVKYERWGSPKFIGGESYGTTRAAHLSGWLIDNGIALNGVMMISATAFAQQDGDSRALAFFPSYAAVSWYHKRLAPDLQALPVAKVVEQAQAFADGPYLIALRKGNRLTATERQQVVAEYSRLTGLDKAFVDQNDLRIDLSRFDHELLRDKGVMVGRLDGRFLGHASDAAAERNDFDPSEASIRNSFTPVLNEFMRRELNYRNDDIYYILGGGIGPWNRPANLEVKASLEKAFNKNPAMKMYVAMGYYDTATPYWGVEYTLSHLKVSPEVRKNNVQVGYFEAGHMMYIDAPSMKKLRADLQRFYDSSLGRTTTLP